MNSTKKILLILTPIIAFLILIAIMAVRMFNKVEDKLDTLNYNIEQKANGSYDFEFDDNAKTIYGNKNVIKTSHSLQTFDKIVLKGAYKVGLIRCDSSYLILETDENLHESISTTVEDAILEVKMIDNIKEAEKLNVYIYYQNISNIEVNGAALITNQDVFVGEELSVELKGAASLELELNVSELNLNMAGGTHAQLSGRCANADYNIRGVGALSAYKLVTDSTKVHVAGAGSARVFANDYLDAMIAGAGTIKYMGKPTLKKIIAGIGRISKAE